MIEEEAKSIWKSIQEVLEFHILELGEYHLSIYNIIVVLVILLIAKLITSNLAKYLRNRITKKEDPTDGKALAIIQIGKYVIFLLAILLSIRSLGFDITPILLGSSALFVGLGFGLQDAFKDFISGLILLFEGDTLIGDIIEFENGILGTVKEIKLRTSKVRTRDGIVIFVPNSQLTNNRVINWTNSNVLTRFHVSVGVAYGSDTTLVEKILLEVAMEDDAVNMKIKPFVRFLDFGDSSLDFEIHFWSKEVWRIEFVKSRMRFEIDKKFRENNVSIPFPQRDLHVKNSQVPFTPKE
ncbi:mechanosensitive ion channel [Vicingaceae bacterium]|nr:mechanosensitive ion channel [Vicingaceae bacterium]MDB4060948.1 mechanosensitive ion channel [Vicingaceae bacterium]MDB9963767.1 mechanosensitive ion channel [Vicingaceae bacterium]MDC0004959.1 mechanosensitive ion channel [bacterium]MDC1450889.1 mechanosensitive ion channel [Vicingaceae bacterium]